MSRVLLDEDEGADCMVVLIVSMSARKEAVEVLVNSSRPLERKPTRAVVIHNRGTWVYAACVTRQVEKARKLRPALRMIPTTLAPAKNLT